MRTKWLTIAAGLCITAVAIFRWHDRDPSDSNQRVTSPDTKQEAHTAAISAPPVTQRTATPEAPDEQAVNAQQAEIDASEHQESFASSTSTTSDSVAATSQTRSYDSEPVLRESVAWSVDINGITGAIEESLPQIRTCYEEWLKSNPAIKGKVTTRITIEPDTAPERLRLNRGKVTKVEILDSTLQHKLLEGCVASVMSSLPFEAPAQDKLIVSYPFTFESLEQDDNDQ